MKTVPRARRGRPSKFGRPSQVVALTLPEEVVRGLHRLHPDLGWAIVTMFEKTATRTAVDAKIAPDVQLGAIADRRSLIIINRDAFKSLPGIDIIPLDTTRAFLALELGRGMTDLELAVIDRLDSPSVEAHEIKALRKLRAQLRAWRHDRALRFHPRSIIVVERVTGQQADAARTRTPAGSPRSPRSAPTESSKSARPRAAQQDDGGQVAAGVSAACDPDVPIG